MSNKILLVGCGQLGSRHLQAVAALKNISEIHIVDSNNSSLELGKRRLLETVDLNKDIVFKWANEISNTIGHGDLCIIATHAKGRTELIKKIYEELGYKNFLIEKIVSQSLYDYKGLMDFCDSNDILVWVNCKTRAYAVHKYIKSRLDPSELIVFSEIAGNHGLANNGVHAADLFLFYDGTAKINSAGSKIDEILHSSKRGNDIYDLSGVLHGYTDKGSRFILSFSKEHLNPDMIYISSKNQRFTIDHLNNFSHESYADTGWEWKKIDIKENILVSEMTKKFVTDILSKNSCELPTLKVCFPSHEFILSEALPYFNKLLKKDRDYCPVT